MTTKVNNTVSHKTSQGDVLATKGKLILIPVETPITEPHIYLIDSEKIVRLKNQVWVKPIIISEIEKVQIDDAWYNITTRRLELKATEQHINEIDFAKSVSYNGCYRKKVLVLSERFSPKQLRAISEGKLQDHDDVYVECDNNMLYNGLKVEDIVEEQDKGVIPDSHVKVNSNKHITLHKIGPKLYTEEEEMCIMNMQYYYEYCDRNGYTTPQEWIRLHKHFI